MKTMTFKEFLLEFDSADLQIQHDRNDAIQRKSDDSRDAKEFRAKMDAQRTKKNQDMTGSKSKEGEPSKGDVLQSPSGKQFSVLGRTNAGFRVRELGGNGKEGNLPHGRKYKAISKTPLGKVIYKLT